jgi:hypothetical protein
MMTILTGSLDNITEIQQQYNEFIQTHKVFATQPQVVLNNKGIACILLFVYYTERVV